MFSVLFISCGVFLQCTYHSTICQQLINPVIYLIAHCQGDALAAYRLQSFQIWTHALGSSMFPADTATSCDFMGIKVTRTHNFSWLIDYFLDFNILSTAQGHLRMTFSGLHFFFHDSLQETYLNSLATATKVPLNYFNGDTSTQFNGMAAKVTDRMFASDRPYVCTLDDPGNKAGQATMSMCRATVA